MARHAPGRSTCKWPLDGPFIVLLEQDGTHETDYGVLVGKDVDDVGAPLDLRR